MNCIFFSTEKDMNCPHCPFCHIALSQDLKCPKCKLEFFLCNACKGVYHKKYIVEEKKICVFCSKEHCWTCKSKLEEKMIPLGRNMHCHAMKVCTNPGCKWHYFVCTNCSALDIAEGNISPQKGSFCESCGLHFCRSCVAKYGTYENEDYPDGYVCKSCM